MEEGDDFFRHLAKAGFRFFFRFFLPLFIAGLLLLPDYIGVVEGAPNCDVIVCCYDQATEVIMTLGQAFEVAYQMALREQFSTASPSPRGGHTRSQSANILATPPVSTHTPVNHTRSLSVNEVKVNGQQVKEMPQTSEEQQPMTSPLQTPKINAPIVQTEEL
uniref:PID domain-containing protein n=1 Tax=Timema bartmani TaxID=61472 RepID=A0A7R9EYP7_9NEOP|nr:unnamed protein product [Timema bartmani]